MPAPPSSPDHPSPFTFTRLLHHLQDEHGVVDPGDLTTREASLLHRHDHLNSEDPHGRTA